jgi:uncharacterized Zn-binding protein involved in type VI secretion
MPGVSRVNQDSAGGAIVGVLVPTVYVNGTNIVCQGAAVSSHGISPHDAPVMVGHSGTVYAGGIAICRQGDSASCGHAASGSGDVFAN